MRTEKLTLFHQLSGVRFIVFCLIACMGAAVLAAGAWRWAEPGSSRSSLIASTQNNQTPEPLIVEELTLRTAGFYPAQLSRPKGKFLLAINNRAGLEEMNLSLVRIIGNGQGEKLRDVKVPRKRLDWNDVFDLHPGTYVVTEASNPKWIYRITVTPN